MADHNEPPISTKPLTPLERRELRVLLRDKERRSWLKKQIGIWLKYVSAAPAIATGIYFIFQWVLPLFNTMPKK